MCYKLRLIHSIITSICIYVCEIWTLTAELKIRITIFETGIFRKLLIDLVTYRDRITSEEIKNRISQAGHYTIY